MGTVLVLGCDKDLVTSCLQNGQPANGLQGRWGYCSARGRQERHHQQVVLLLIWEQYSFCSSSWCSTGPCMSRQWLWYESPSGGLLHLGSLGMGYSWGWLACRDMRPAVWRVRRYRGIDCCGPHVSSAWGLGWTGIRQMQQQELHPGVDDTGVLSIRARVSRWTGMGGGLPRLRS
jgi:hypothetical protein